MKNGLEEEASSQADPKSAYVMAIYENSDGSVMELKRSYVIAQIFCRNVSNNIELRAQDQVNLESMASRSPQLNTRINWRKKTF